MIFVTNDKHRFLLPDDDLEFPITIPGIFAKYAPLEGEKLKTLVSEAPTKQEDWKFYSLVRFRDLSPWWITPNPEEVYDAVICILHDMAREDLVDHE